MSLIKVSQRKREWWGNSPYWQVNRCCFELARPWGAPSSQTTSPVKNVHVAALHAASRVGKSPVTAGVTNNPLRPFHCQGMFYRRYFNLALSARYTIQKPDLQTGDWRRDWMELYVFPLGLFINWDMWGTPREHGVACEIRLSLCGKSSSEN